jgi:hypothetical protein
LLHHRSDLLRGDDLAALRADEPGEHPAAGGVVDHAVALLLALLRLVELGDVAADTEHEAVSERDEAKEPHQHEEGEKAELADPAPALAAFAVRRWSKGTSQNPRILALAFSAGGLSAPAEPASEAA